MPTNVSEAEQAQERSSAVQALKASEQRFRAYFEQSMFGMATTGPDNQWIEFNQAFCDLFGYTPEEIKTRTWADLPHPNGDDSQEVLIQQLVGGAIDDFVIETRYVRKSGDIIDALLATRAVRNQDDSLAYAVTQIEDITLRKLAERREQMRRTALEKVARGAPLKEVMLQIVEAAEAIYPGTMCSILLMDREGKHLLIGAAPSLPDTYNDAIHGVQIGMGVGSCGTAAFTGKRTIVSDIASHPYWKDYKQAALEAGLAASWSEPILAASGKVLGTFAIYRSKASSPDEQEIALIESVANLVAIVIERARAEEELHLAASIYNNSTESVLVADANNRIMAINPAFARTTGYSLEEIRGKDPAVLSSGRHDAAFFKAMWKEINEKGCWQGEIWNRRKNGETFPEWLTINTIHSDSGEIQHYVAMGWDITKKIRSDELIWRQANYDFLTDLPNRYMFQDRLEQEIRSSKRENSLLALLFIDLDHFKDVNDSLGHPVGDQLLIQTAERINHCVRVSDTVARMGGDEFTVILRDLANTLDAETVAEQIISELAVPYSINGETIYATASVGIAFCPNDATGVDQLISNADQAMYASKTAGRNRISYFTRELQESALNRLALIADMRLALQNHEFELFFQPIIDLDSGAIVYAESLIRWHHPKRGLVPPDRFIPIAEESKLIVPIGEWVIDSACRQLAEWRANGTVPDDFALSVNVSKVELMTPGFPAALISRIDAHGLPRTSIKIEVTETTIVDNRSDVSSVLDNLRSQSIVVMMDDFGTGHSSLSGLHKLPIDELKIDQSFISNADSNTDLIAITSSIVSLADHLSLRTIGEGIETPEHIAILQTMGCMYGQGYFWSRPVPAPEFEAYLAEKTGRVPVSVA